MYCYLLSNIKKAAALSATVIIEKRKDIFMANILDYLDWRGDIPFSVSPINEVDNLIFSQFSFIDLEGIVPSRVSAGGMPLHEAVARYFAAHPDESTKMGLIVPAAIRTLLRRLSECPRYRDLIVAGYVNIIDENVQKQFAALTILIDERQLYVTYRGTDDTLVGWKENFNMSFMQAIPAQLDAVAYLNHVAADTTHPCIYVGGHSKGGNLAIYAAIHCEKSVKPRIARIYSNDGPGYHREVVDSPEYKEMEPLINNIVPQSSVVGRLLEHDDHYTVVQSTATGLWQHDGFSWEVKGTNFLVAPTLSAESARIEQSVKHWVAEMDDKQREKFVDAFYRVLTATNAKTLTDLTRDRNWFWHLMTNSELSESRKTVMAGLTQLTGEAGKQWIEGIKKSKKTADGAASSTPSTAAKPRTKASAAVPFKSAKVTTKKTTPVNKKPPQTAVGGEGAASEKKSAQQVIKDILATADQKVRSTAGKMQAAKQTSAVHTGAKPVGNKAKPNKTTKTE
jgi:hypothetical protein